MRCASCTSLLDETATFCDTCLAPVEREAPRNAPAQPVEPPPDVEPEPEEAQVPAQPDSQPCAEHPDFPIAGTCKRCGKFVCVRCAPELAQRSSGARCQACADLEDLGDKDLEGVGGWLLLLVVQIGLGSLLALAGAVLAAARSPLLALFTGAIGALGGTAVLLTFMHRKTAVFLLLAFIWLNAVSGLLSGSVFGASRALIAGLLWTGYLMSSKRVRQTLVK